MWFRFPKGADKISVECQQFVSELVHEGIDYFRAPDHFATRILSIPGFARVETPPDGAPPDLPKADPIRDNSIVELTKANEALKTSAQNMQADLIAANAKVRALVDEKTKLQLDLQTALEKISTLEEDAEEESEKKVVTLGGKK